MNTILLTNEHELIPTVSHCIMQRSNLIDNIEFLVPKNYEDYDMSQFDCLLEYILPVSKRYSSVFLTLDDTNYKEDYLRYVLKADTEITEEAGEVELQLTFGNVELSPDGEMSIQTVRKTQTCTIPVTPIAAWADIIPNGALTALDQRIIELKGVAKALDSLNQEIYTNQVDTLILDDGKLSVGVKATNKKLGDEISIVLPSESDNLDGTEDGIVDLDNVTIDGDGNNDNEDSEGGFVEL